MDWIDVKIEVPKEIGWYQIKTKDGEFEAPYVNNAVREKVWVLPDPSIITHWRNKT